MTVYNNELYHWGIKGMKWGVRRYQNQDGTLTSAGRKRYSADDYKNGVKKAGNIAKQPLKDTARPMDKDGWAPQGKSNPNPWYGSQRKTVEKLERHYHDPFQRGGLPDHRGGHGLGGEDALCHHPGAEGTEKSGEGSAPRQTLPELPVLHPARVR